MPKEENIEPKKKMVVVEEVKETPKVTEPSKATEVPVITETKDEDLQKALDIKETHADKEEKPNYLWIIIPIALLVGALVGGLITYFSGISKLNTKETPTPEATVEPVVESTPTASPPASIKRDDIKLQVLNGSGVSGLAGKAKTYLEDLGYKDVAVGNASVSNLTETVISVKETKKDLLETVTTDLSKNYKVAKDTETLVASSKYDFVITLGSK